MNETHFERHNGPRAALRDVEPVYVRFGSGADIRRYLDHVRFTPESGQIADISRCPLCAKSRLMRRSKNGCSLNHLVDAAQQRQRHCDAERLGGLEVDRESVLSRRLH